MMNEPIHSIMTKKVLTLRPENTLAEAREILMNNHIHHLPVIDENRKLVGMVTSWDMFKLGIGASEYAATLVRDAMSKKLASLEPEQHIGAVAELLLEHLFHAVPIVNDKGQLEGIVTSTDVIRYEYGKEYPDNLDKFVPENM